MDKTEETAEEGKKTGPRLGMSKFIYALGTSARDALAWGLGALAVTTVVFGAFGHKVEFLQKIADFPKKVKDSIFTGKTGTRWGQALVVGMGIGAIVSWIAHIPGLVMGPRKVIAAQKIFQEEVDKGERLVKANTLLAEDNERLKLALAEGEMKRKSMVERVQSQPAAGAGVGTP